MLKPTVFLIIFLAGSILINAQKTSQPVQLTHYVFDSFTKGKVKVKSGTVSDQVLNYNILTGEMIYDDNGKFLAISNPEDVDTVYIDNRKFVPVGGKFYEVLHEPPAPLFLEVTCTISEQGAPLGYGMSSNTTASTSLRELIQSGGAYSLKLPDNFKVTPKYTYLVFQDGRYQKSNNLQQLIKIFPEKKKQLRGFAAKHNTDFDERADVIDIVREAGAN